MPIERKTKLGNISVSEEAIATLAGDAVAECYGVVGMASRSLLKDGFYELLRKENYAKGIVVTNNGDSYDLDLYIVISYGVKISEVVTEVQKKVKYELEKELDLTFRCVNIFVQGVRVGK
ncbi:MAG: Asp23/Gls24 family envelope stress response protein [Erysipelotrichaceae bacterium]|nr:Asp23/Gls24 family envelope stress response protein [Erysipelotrichaceae bacterium]